MHNNKSLLDLPINNFDLMDPEFGMMNVTILFSLLLREDEPGLVLSYNASIATQVEVQQRTRLQLHLVFPYNTHIDARIAARLCGQQSTPIIIQLNYGEYNEIELYTTIDLN